MTGKQWCEAKGQLHFMHMAGYELVKTSEAFPDKIHINLSLPSSSPRECWGSWEEFIRRQQKKEKHVISVCSASEQPFFINLQELEIINFKDQQTWIIINTINLRYLIQNNEMKYHSLGKDWCVYKSWDISNPKCKQLKDNSELSRLDTGH